MKRLILDKLPQSTKFVLKLTLARLTGRCIQLASRIVRLDEKRLRHAAGRCGLDLKPKPSHSTGSPSRTKAEPSLGPSIVVFDDHVPTPDRDSGSVRMALILKILAKWGRLLFIPLRSPLSPGYERRLWKDGIETAHITDYKKLMKERNVAAAILSRPDVADALLPSIRRIRKDIKIVFDTVDVHFVRLEREHKLTGDRSAEEAARRYRKLETRLARDSDQVWCVTPEDKEALAKEASSASINVVPNIHALHDRGSRFADRHGLMFIGSFLHQPNVDAVHYFVREIYPLVRNAISGMTFHVVGGDVPQSIKNYAGDGITVTGFVPDVSQLFHKCRVFVAPLRYGAGMKGKL